MLWEYWPWKRAFCFKLLSKFTHILINSSVLLRSIRNSNTKFLWRAWNFQRTALFSKFHIIHIRILCRYPYVWYIDIVAPILIIIINALSEYSHDERSSSQTAWHKIIHAIELVMVNHEWQPYWICVVCMPERNLWRYWMESRS